MGALFSKPSAPMPQPVPANPANDQGAEKQRMEAERTALSDRLARGRAATMAAGADMAAEDQYGRGLLKRRQRIGNAVSSAVLG